MRVIYAFLITLIASPLFAQQQPVTYQEITVGKNLLANKEIKAIQYSFPEWIYEFHLDSPSIFTAQLRNVNSNKSKFGNDGRLMVYDLEKKQVRWSKNIRYNNTQIAQFRNIFFKAKHGKSYLLDTETGEDIGPFTNLPFHYNQNWNITIGYSLKNEITVHEKLEGFYMNTETVIWTRWLGVKYGYTRLLYLNDSVMLIEAEGLHTLNIKNGKGWNYKARTFDDRYADLLWNMSSNVIIDSSVFYMACSDEICKINDEGELIWKKNLDMDLTGNSDIYIRDSILYLINKGYVMSKGAVTPYGIPYIAAYHAKTGKQLFYHPVDDVSGIIMSAHFMENSIFLLSANSIEKRDVMTGAFISQMPFKDSLEGFVSKDIYIKSGTTYKPLGELDPTKEYIINVKGGISVIDDSISVIAEFDTADCYFIYHVSGDHKFLRQKQETIIVNSFGIKIAEFPALANPMVARRKLYGYKEETFTEIDLSNILN